MANFDQKAKGLLEIFNKALNDEWWIYGVSIYILHVKIGYQYLKLYEDFTFLTISESLNTIFHIFQYFHVV